MKAFLVTLILVSFLSVCLSAQINKKEVLPGFKLDTTLSISPIRPGLNFNILKNPSLKFDLNIPKYYSYNLPKIKDERDLVFPGASTFYNAGSTFNIASNEERFVIKPDNNYKGFLLIKNPFDTLYKLK